ncbi:hypothetical protein FNV43_RR00522 [Rhamnella rubrinervis]|uniref:Uncharacterized protein n=1 Tax=Rhamnella rubrinervis TaxID=2594499 RepID=A0A8K0HQJ9_9ROSA|nr:hypothetical protein FNV43_RR00522 [Rhamnella rubrinervis]
MKIGCDVVVEGNDKTEEPIDNMRSVAVNMDGGEKDIGGTNDATQETNDLLNDGSKLDKLIEAKEKNAAEGSIMADDEIFDMVMPLRSDYVPGFGSGPKPTPKPHRILVQ